MNGVDILAGLNDRQLEAVKATEGYVRVIAGAGSGKTKALVCRYAYIVEVLGISASNILCVTFTNKAAGEMKRRVRGLVDLGNVNDLICTYHGFCVRVLREDIQKLNYPKGFIVLDEEDQKGILREIYAEMDLTVNDISHKKALEAIHGYKTITNPTYIADHITCEGDIIIDDSMSKVTQVVLHYIQKQKKMFALDFDDLIEFTFYIFDNYEDILEKWQTRLCYIMVDETQDNSGRQWGFVGLLSRKHKNLFVVGDPDQAIYEWRGALPAYLVNFDKMFTPCHTIIMDQNYRSTPNILDVANCVIKNNKNRIDKDLFTKSMQGISVVHFHGKDEQEEAKWIGQTITEKVKNGASLKDFAVLYRAGYLSRSIEQALMTQNIPYVIYGGIRFFERKEIKDALSYLRMIDSGDNISFLRTINNPSRKLGKVFIDTLKEKAEQDGLSLYETLKDNIDMPGLNKPSAQEFISLIEDGRRKTDELSISDLLNYILDKSGLITQIRLDGDED